MMTEIDWEYATRVELHTKSALYIWEKDCSVLQRISEVPVIGVDGNPITERPLWPMRLKHGEMPHEGVAWRCEIARVLDDGLTWITLTTTKILKIKEIY